MKTCTSCKIAKDVSAFTIRRASKDGLCPLCKDCKHAQESKRYRENPQAAIDRTTQWRAKNPEATLAQRAKYRDKHRPVIAAKNRVRYAENIDAERARTARYHARNPTKALERGKRWAEENPEAARARSTRRRSRVAGAEGAHTGDDIRAIHAMQKGCCAICRAPLDSYHVDHIVPITLGGSNWPSNLQLACGTCNRQKGAKPPERFMQERGLLL